jgi:hypothetical protein
MNGLRAGMSAAPLMAAARVAAGVTSVTVCGSPRRPTSTVGRKSRPQNGREASATKTSAGSSETYAMHGGTPHCAEGAGGGALTYRPRLQGA